MTTVRDESQAALPSIFVLGATGTVGGVIAQQLVQAGVPFRVGVRRPGSVALPPGTDVQRGVKPVIEVAAVGVEQIAFLPILGS